MQLKVKFRDPKAENLDLKGVGIQVREGCLWIYVKGPEEPDVDMYPLDTIEKFTVREQEEETNNVVPIRAN